MANQVADQDAAVVEVKRQSIAGVPPEIEVPFRKAMPLEQSRYPGLQPGSRVLEAGTTYREGGRPLAVDVIEDRDVAVPLRDGTTIYVDIFRPVDSGPVPAILAWSPYGKRNGFLSNDIFPNRMDVDPSWEDGLNKFEAPNPSYWVEHGYAVVNSDSRGVCSSGGDIQGFGQQDAMDEYDLIEWLGEAEWCDGQVALAGNSWLSMTQYFVAALRPPHLAAIAPWEGAGDLYRESSRRGGIPDVAFSSGSLRALVGHGYTEDMPAMGISEHPTFDAYWASKVPDYAAIEVPAYVVASWTNLLHTHGSLHGFRSISSQRKWLRVHNTHEWYDFFHPANVEDLRRFYDHVMKGADNGWEATPPVRLSVLDPGHGPVNVDTVGRAEAEWPLSRVVPTTFHVDLAGERLADATPAPAARTYDSATGSVVLRHTFERETELTGYGKLHLWITAEDADDADVFVFLSKLDASGEEQLARVVTDRYHAGMNGRLRASMRATDPERSTLAEPFHPFTTIEPLEPGVPVELDIALWPYSMRFHTGETLQVRIGGTDLLVRPEMPDLPPDPTVNRGRHTVHSGGEHDSYLVLPIDPRP